VTLFRQIKTIKGHHSGTGPTGNLIRGYNCGKESSNKIAFEKDVTGFGEAVIELKWCHDSKVEELAA